MSTNRQIALDLQNRVLELRAEVERLREALEEILSDPDASRGGYGCRDFHEARTIARQTLDHLWSDKPAFDEKRSPG